MYNFEKLGIQIRRRRKELNLTLNQVAEICGISERTAGNIERGQTEAKLENVMKIFDVLGIPYEEIHNCYHRSEETQNAMDLIMKNK